MQLCGNKARVPTACVSEHAATVLAADDVQHPSSPRCNPSRRRATCDTGLLAHIHFWTKNEGPRSMHCATQVQHTGQQACDATVLVPVGWAHWVARPTCEHEVVIDIPLQAPCQLARTTWQHDIGTADRLAAMHLEDQASSCIYARCCARRSFRACVTTEGPAHLCLVDVLDRLLAEADVSPRIEISECNLVPGIPRSLCAAMSAAGSASCLRKCDAV